MANLIKMTIQIRRDTAANWELYKDIVPAAGEPCFVLDENILKIGDGVTTFENLEPINGAKFEIAADGKSVVLEDNILKLMGFDAAEAGAQPRKNAEGNLEWVVPSTETVEGLQTTVAGLQSDVATLQDKVATLEEIVGATEEGEEGTLLDRVSALETGVETLNGDETVEGSVKKTVNDAIDEFAAKISDDGTVNTLKELVDYVAEHGNEAADMAADIANLQALVGTTSVESQIEMAVAGLVKAEVDKGLSTNDFTDTLLEKLDGIEAGAQVNKIEEVYVGETLLDIVDKKVVIPVGAGLKGSDEIVVAEDGTLGIGKISFSKIIQEEDEEVVLNGGGAAG